MSFTSTPSHISLISDLHTHPSMPSLIPLSDDHSSHTYTTDWSTSDFLENSLDSEIGTIDSYTPNNTQMVFPLNPHMLPPFSHIFLKYADFFLIIEKEQDNYYSFYSPPPYHFFLFAQNIAPLPNVYIHLNPSLFSHITLP